MITQPPIRILIADDHPVIRNGLTTIVHYKTEMEIVAEATNGLEAIEQFRKSISRCHTDGFASA